MSSASLPLLVFVDTYPNAERGNLTNQVKRERLIEWKLNRICRHFETGKLFREGFNRRPCRVKADVMFEACERDQYPPVRIGRHVPLQTFSRSWRSFTNSCAYFT